MYTLILTIMLVWGVSTDSIPNFTSLELCQEAAKTHSGDIIKKLPGAYVITSCPKNSEKGK